MGSQRVRQTDLSYWATKRGQETWQQVNCVAETFWRPVRLWLEVGGWGEVLGPLRGLGALQKPGVLVVSWAADDVQDFCSQGIPNTGDHSRYRRAIHWAEGWEPREWLCLKRKTALGSLLSQTWQERPWPGGQETSSEAKAFVLNPHQGSKTPACHQGRVQPMSLKIRAGFALWALSTSGSNHCFGGHCVHFMMLTASQLLPTSGQEQPLPVWPPLNVSRQGQMLPGE